MSIGRKAILTGGTVGCALAIGYFMQQGGQVSEPMAALIPAPVQQAVLDPHLPNEENPLDLQQVTLTSAQPKTAVMGLTQSYLTTAAWSGTSAPPQLSCDVHAETQTAPLAMVTLSIDAPCYDNERITIHHSGMMFTEFTDKNGQLTVTVPALNQNAVFIAEFENGEGAVAIGRVPSLPEFERVVVQWSGYNGIQIHAREFGANYGDAGHVWSDSPNRDPNGGMVNRLRNSTALMPKLAEVYTYPSGHSAQSGTVILSIETEVTQMNCAREISAQSLELRGAAPLRTRDIILSMPGCSSIGDFLVLNNLVDDLKIAAR